MDLRLDGPPVRTARAVQGPPCAMVIFGSSGDLTKRLLIPALYNLAKAGRLSDKFALIGVDRSTSIETATTRAAVASIL